MTRAEQHLVAELRCHRPQARELGQAGDRAPGAGPRRAARRSDGLSPRPTASRGRRASCVVQRGCRQLPSHRRPRSAETNRPSKLAAPPDVTGQQDSNATVTALAAFASCPRKYYLARLPGLRGRVRAAGRPALAGDRRRRPNSRRRVRHPGPRPAGRERRAGRQRPKPSGWPKSSAQSPLGRRAARATRVWRANSIS